MKEKREDDNEDTRGGNHPLLALPTVACRAGDGVSSGPERFLLN